MVLTKNVFFVRCVRLHTQMVTKVICCSALALTILVGFFFFFYEIPKCSGIEVNFLDIDSPSSSSSVEQVCFEKGFEATN